MYNLRFPETWSGQIANITYKHSSPSIITFRTILEKNIFECTRRYLSIGMPAKSIQGQSITIKIRIESYVCKKIKLWCKNFESNISVGNIFFLSVSSLLMTSYPKRTDAVYDRVSQKEKKLILLSSEGLSGKCDGDGKDFISWQSETRAAS